MKKLLYLIITSSALAQVPDGYKLVTNIHAIPIQHYYALVTNQHELVYLGDYSSDTDFQKDNQQFVSTQAFAVITLSKKIEHATLNWKREKAVIKPPPMPRHYDKAEITNSIIAKQ